MMSEIFLAALVSAINELCFLRCFFHYEELDFLLALQVLSGNIEHVRIKEKAKFAKDFFPDVSRFQFISCQTSNASPTNLHFHADKIGVRCGPVVSVLDCQSRGLGFKPGQNFALRFLLRLCLLANSAGMSTLTIHCQWEDDSEEEDWSPTLMYYNC